MLQLSRQPPGDCQLWLSNYGVNLLRMVEQDARRPVYLSKGDHDSALAIPLLEKASLIQEA